MEQKPVTLGYWNIRGLAEPIRLFLEYVQVPYTEVKYTAENSGEWFQKDKPNLKCDFPNIPYMKDGDYVVSESDAVLSYVAVKANNQDLAGAKNIVRFNELKGVMYDVRSALVKSFYSADFNNIKESTFQGLHPKFQTFNKILGQHAYLLGDQITYLDFVFFEVLQVLHICDPNYLKEEANLKKYVQKISELPNIKAYLASSRFIERPINNSMASFK